MSKQQIAAEGVIAPARFELKARVVAVGYRTYREFAEKLEIDPTRLSRVLNGHEFPSRTVQKRLARELGITLKDLRAML